MANTPSLNFRTNKRKAKTIEPGRLGDRPFVFTFAAFQTGHLCVPK